MISHQTQTPHIQPTQQVYHVHPKFPNQAFQSNNIKNQRETHIYRKGKKVKRLANRIQEGVNL